MSFLKQVPALSQNAEGLENAESKLHSLAEWERFILLRRNAHVRRSVSSHIFVLELQFFFIALCLCPCDNAFLLFISKIGDALDMMLSKY